MRVNASRDHDIYESISIMPHIHNYELSLGMTTESYKYTVFQINNFISVLHIWRSTEDPNRTEVSKYPVEILNLK